MLKRLSLVAIASLLIVQPAQAMVWLGIPPLIFAGLTGGTLGLKIALKKETPQTLAQDAGITYVEGNWMADKLTVISPVKGTGFKKLNKKLNAFHSLIIETYGADTQLNEVPDLMPILTARLVVAPGTKLNAEYGTMTLTQYLGAEGAINYQTTSNVAARLMSFCSRHSKVCLQAPEPSFVAATVKKSN